MAADAAAGEAWRPGQPVQDSTRLGDVLAALSFGHNDDSYTSISEKLAQRNCLTVGQLDSWSKGEMISLIRPLKLKKLPVAYVAAIEVAAKRTFQADPAMKGEDKVKAPCGGDLPHIKCTKVAPSETFNASQYLPDGCVYVGVPTLSLQDVLDPEEEKLYVDALWIDAQANPEPSLGDYIPSGLARRYESLHTQLKLAKLPPSHAGKVNEAARGVQRAVHLRFQNGRQGINGRPYKRMVFDDAYESHISEKARAFVCFVPSTSVELHDNRRNDLLRDLIKVYAGEMPKMRVSFPTDPATTDPETPEVVREAKTAAVDIDEGSPPDSEANAKDVTDLDGKELADGDSSDEEGARNLPQLPKRAANNSSTSGETKKQKLKEKKAAAAAKSKTAAPAASSVPKKRIARESSDEENDSSDDEDSSERCGRLRASASVTLAP